MEVEQTSADGAKIERPWNPEHIRVTTSAFSLRNILDQIDEGALELAPDFQRGKVWRAEQKSLLVESLLLQIPLPAFYFAEDTDGGFHVVDGLQRLSTLHAFVRGPKFALRGLEYLHDADGRRFDELDMQWQRRINNTQLVVNVIDPTTPADVMYDIFKRINTGGTPLNAQEIRHCMSKPRSREILRQMTHTPEFSMATNGLTDHIRMNDREMALRFAAFYILGLDDYMRNPAMETFLMRATQLLDNSDKFADTDVERLKAAFVKAMSNTHLVFGEHAFRKWAKHAHGRSPINRALFETWSIAMARHEAGDLARRKDAIVAAARERMTSDIDYLDSITSSTADRRRVRYRFNAADEDARVGR
ncbi:GmrSD restriction endonuclease domain-containing protein [Amycolatopsis oliviviridis]